MRFGIIGPSEDEIMPFIEQIQDKKIEIMAKLTFYSGTFNDIEVVALYCGVCKVNAALATQLLIDKFNITHVIEPNMLETIWCATNRITRRGVQLAEEERISVLDAIRAVTANAAYQYFEEDKKGTLEVGKLADMIVLDKDPLSVDKADVRDIQILKTYKSGKCIFEKETV